jgi:hypothetical protein
MIALIVSQSARRSRGILFRVVGTRRGSGDAGHQ